MKQILLVILAALDIAACCISCDTHEPNEPGLLVPLTADEDLTIPHIDVNGTRLHAESFGDNRNPMIVVLHGGPGQDYRSMLKCSGFTVDSFFVVFYDQRGTGLSRRHDAESFTLQQFIDDLDAVIGHFRTLPDQKIILMGHSWGAMLATAYINQYPARIAGAVLMEPGGFTWQQAKEFIKKEQHINPTSESTSDLVYMDQFITGHDHEVLDYKLILQMQIDFRPGNSVGNAGPYPFWRPGAVSTTALKDKAEKDPFDFTTNLSQYTKKIMFVYSELNTSYGGEYAQKLASYYPSYQLFEVKGAGHEMAYFAWENFHAGVLPYLESVK